MDDIKSEDKVRKTVSLTHRQLGFGAFSLAALMSVGQLKEIKEFFIGEQATAIARIEATQISNHREIKDLLILHTADEQVKRQRLFDIVTTNIAASESRCEKRADDLHTDVHDLQVFAFKNKSHGSQN